MNHYVRYLKISLGEAKKIDVRSLLKLQQQLSAYEIGYIENKQCKDLVESIKLKYKTSIQKRLHTKKLPNSFDDDFELYFQTAIEHNAIN